MIRIPYPAVVDVLVAILLRLGFGAVRARLCARLFAEASRDGVSSHGLDRFHASFAESEKES